jgi:hypothetical protein
VCLTAPAATQVCVAVTGWGPNQLTGAAAYNAICNATRGCVAWVDGPGVTGCAYLTAAGARPLCQC